MFSKSINTYDKDMEHGDATPTHHDSNPLMIREWPMPYHCQCLIFFNPVSPFFCPLTACECMYKVAA